MKKQKAVDVFKQNHFCIERGSVSSVRFRYFNLKNDIRTAFFFILIMHVKQTQKSRRMHDKALMNRSEMLQCYGSGSECSNWSNAKHQI